MLKISKTLELPFDYATQTVAILAKKRVGKTYTASVIAEECCEANIPFVVLDPTGAWYGLRSSRDGKADGYPVIIIGGAHGDIPLEFSAGKTIAEFVVENPGFYVLDLSLSESDEEQDGFATAFAQRLYRLKNLNRDPLHLFVDEADSFAPQTVDKNQKPMLKAFEAIVRRGGIRGLGMTMITQRSAILNNNILTQAEVLIILQTNGPADIAAVDLWLKQSVTKEQREIFLSTVTSLGQGEAWVWSPEWLEIFERVKIRERRTFNSSATPKVGEKRNEPVRLADVDLAALSAQMSETIEKVTSEDPIILKKKIADLEKQLRDRPKEAASSDALNASEMERVRLQAVLDQMSQKHNDLIAAKDELFKGIGGVFHHIHLDLARHMDKADKAFDGVKMEDRPVAQIADFKPMSQKQEFQKQPISSANIEDERISLRASSNNAAPRTMVSNPQQRVLDAIALCENLLMDSPARNTVAAFAGYIDNKSFRNHLSSLKTASLIDYPSASTVCFTDRGRELANPNAVQIKTLSDFHELWKSKLSNPEARILDELLPYRGDPISRELVAIRTGYEFNKSFKNLLSTLSTLGLVSYPDKSHVQISESLFPAGLK